MTPTYTEESVLHFAQVVRTLTGVQLTQNDSHIELERLREDYASPADRERWVGQLERTTPTSIDYGNV